MAPEGSPWTEASLATQQEAPALPFVARKPAGRDFATAGLGEQASEKSDDELHSLHPVADSPQVWSITPGWAQKIVVGAFAPQLR